MSEGSVAPSSGSGSQRRLALAGGVGTGIAALALCLATRARTVGWGDNGELAAAAWVLGIPHTPGYPLWTPLARLFALLPLGEPAARLALFSCVCGALCCGLLAFMVGRISGNAWAGVVGGALLAAAPTFWDQATTVEVYPLAMLLLVVLWGLAWRTGSGEGGRPVRGALPLFAFVYGLAAGSHMMLMTLAPAFLYLLWRRGALTRRALPSLAAFALGLSVFAYLPIRAAQNPPVNFGNPSTWPAFVAHVTGQASRLHMFEIPFPQMWQRVEGVSRLLVSDFTWLGLGLAAIGWLALIGRDWTLWVFLSLVKLISLTVAANYNIIDNEVYLLPYYVAEGALAGFGAALLAEAAAKAGTRVRARAGLSAGGAMVLLLAIPLMNAAANFGAMDKGGDYGAADFEAAALENAAPGAYLVTDWWLGGPLLYGRYVEKRRDDVAVVPLFSKARPWERFEALAQGTAFAGRPVYVGEQVTDCMRTVENLVCLAPAGPLQRAYWLRPDLSAGERKPKVAERFELAGGLRLRGLTGVRTSCAQGGTARVEVWWEVGPEFDFAEGRLRYALDAVDSGKRVWRGDATLAASATRGLLVDEQVLGPLTDAPPGKYRAVAIANVPRPRVVGLPVVIGVTPRGGR